MISKEELSDSVLLIHKPSGMTSFDVIGRLRRILSQRKIGHAGTLDKAASGLLVVCAGKSTRLSPYFLEKDKSYKGVVQLGIDTDTCDREGEILRRTDPSYVTDSMLAAAVERFKGDIMQKPPIYSALKFGGRRASDLVRCGKEPEMFERPVTIRCCEVTAFDRNEMTVSLNVSCSKGTYIRSIARDLGEILGCGGYLRELVRTASGTFLLDDAVNPDELSASISQGSAGKKFWLTPLEAVGEMGLIVLNAAGEAKVMNGAQFSKETVVSIAKGNGLYAVTDTDKNLIAIVDIDTDNWQIDYRNVFNK